MDKRSRIVNIVLSGGGIKGIAFAGAYEEIEKKYKRIGNVAGVSAGALVGALIGAGYTSRELGRIMKEFDFSSLSDMDEIPMDISIANNMRSIEQERKVVSESDLETLLHRQNYSELNLVRKSKEDFVGSRGNFLVNLIAFSKKNAFLNGELLEQWVAQLLANKGIYTFSDFRGGIADKVNPRGYKVRMTAVDANTGKVIVLPDDMALYNIDPDKLEVAKAVRMSTCVPFVFDPVTIDFKDAGNKPKTHYIIDGGVLDNFPVWLIDSTENNVIIGLKLEGKEPKGLGSAEHMLKKLLHSSHDTGVPKNSYNIDNIAHINTGDISFLDFDINEEESLYLYNQGKLAVQKLFVSMQKKTRGWRI